jgi:heat-inducible transcriptional repressor
LEKLSKKQQREREVLLALIDLYIEQGKPIGSNTLKENRFPALSSATLRNYFAGLEEAGLLTQHHASGGRVPTSKAYEIYAAHYIEHPPELPKHLRLFDGLSELEGKDLHRFLNLATERLSQKSGCAAFLSSVRFDHDFIEKISLVGVDEERTLCVLITEFGQILTEVISYPEKISSFTLKRMEAYMLCKVRGTIQSVEIPPEEERLAEFFYSEVMVRYLVRYSNFTEAEVFRTGFAQLLHYPEFNDPLALTTGLSFFENVGAMRKLLNQCTMRGGIQYWIGKQLSAFSPLADGCSVLAVPYKIGESHVGAMGILSTTRIPYQELISLLQVFSDVVSETLTKTLHRYKLSYRRPQEGSYYLENEERLIALQTQSHKIENKDHL